MIITIHQPEHLPWLGYFNKMAKAELFVIMDNVQFEKNYFQNRNRIIGTNGVQWIGVPVKTVGHMDNILRDTEIAGDNRWKNKYLKTIQMSYGKHPFFDSVFATLEDAVALDTNKLTDINVSIFKNFADKMDIRPEFVRASELDVQGKKSDLVLEICKAVNATTYISGPSGRDYMKLETYEQANIEVKFNDYHHPVYEQKRTTEFVPYMSTLDLLMNVGFEQGKNIIMQGNEGLSDK